MKNIFTLIIFCLLRSSIFCQEALPVKGSNGYGVNIDFSNGFGGKFVVSKWGKKNNENQFLVGFTTLKNSSTSTFTSTQPNFSYEKISQKSISLGVQFLKHKLFANGVSAFGGHGLYLDAILPSELISKSFDNNIITEYKIKNSGLFRGGIVIPIGAQIILKKNLAIGVQNNFSLLYNFTINNIELYKDNVLIKKEKNNTNELSFNPILPSLFMRIYFGN
jgi:hypothetical protein